MSVSWYRNWWDAYQEAAFRADIVGVRYRVWFEPNNRWWHITETTVPIPGRSR